MPRKPFRSDLTDAEWAILVALTPGFNRVGARRPTPAANSWMPCVTCFGVGSPGGPCPMNTRPVRRSPTSSASGASIGVGDRSMTGCESGFASRPAQLTAAILDSQLVRTT